MHCTRCQAANQAGARFCEECGAGLAIACRRCGQALTAGKKFCGACGAAAAAPDEGRGPMLTSRAAIEGERKQVTILFADLKGSLELIADMDPEEVRGILDPVLEIMMDAVHQYEGTVNQVMGDGIMALFGAPIAHEDHSARGCYAALRMQERIRKYADSRASPAAPPLQFRIGLNSGDVVVRSVGSDLRMDYTAVGQTTHIAARMEQAAAPNTIYMSAATFALAEGFVEARALGPLAIKGLARPAPVYELLAAKSRRSRFDVQVERGLTQFTGRDAEMAVLRRAHAAAAGGAGQLVAAFGEPGIGKSRLLREFVRAGLSPQLQVLTSARVSYGEGESNLPLADLLRRFLLLEDNASAAATEDEVRRAAASHDSPAIALAPLLWLLGVEPRDEAWQRLQPSQRRGRAIEAAAELLAAASRREPLVVVVEDLQWIDSETQALLDSLVERLPASRILVLVSYRPGYQHAWDGKPGYQALPVPRLLAADAEQLLAALAGASPSLGELREALIQRTDGNAFFIEESVRALIETGHLAGTPGDYVARRDAAEAQIPASVYAVIAARIDRLAAADKRLLQTAAVIGAVVPSMLLESVAELAQDEFRQSIARLESGGFLGALARYPEIEYSFQHALTCEVARQSLVVERRRGLHAAIVRAIEQLYADRLADHVERLAHHALHGEAWPQALRFCREAGARALARSANRAAVTHFEHALQAAGHLGEAQAIEAAIDLRLDLRNAYGPLGEHNKMFEVLAEAERLAEKQGDTRRLALVLSFVSNLFAVRGDFDKALEQGRRALALAEELDDPPSRVVSNAVLAITHWARGEYRHAVERAGWNVRFLAGARQFERQGMAQLPAVYSRTSMAVSLAELGEFEQGIELGGEALAIAEASEHPQSIISACFGLGSACMRRGEFERATTVLERGCAVAEATGLGAAHLELVSPLGSAYALGGRVEDAMKLLKGAVARASALRNPLGHWIRSGGLGEAQLCAGKAAEALPMARLYVEVTRTVRARGNEAWALLLLGEVLARHDGAERDQAEATLRGALLLAQQLEMRPLEGRCLLALGALQRRQADLAAAADIFRPRGMAFWLARAENMSQEVRDG